MAKYLLALKNTSTRMRAQANSWKEIAVGFKAFLESRIYSKADDEGRIRFKKCFQLNESQCLML